MGSAGAEQKDAHWGSFCAPIWGPVCAPIDNTIEENEMKSPIACLIAAVLFALAGVTPVAADDAAVPSIIEVPNGIHVNGCADFTLIEGRAQQLCKLDSVPRRDFLSVTEFFRAFRGAGGSSEGGSDESSPTSN